MRNTHRDGFNWPAMMRSTVFLFFVSVALPNIALAQTDSSSNNSDSRKESYSQQIQDMFNQSQTQAKSQFDKSYPKPSVPKTPPLSPPPAQKNDQEPPKNTGGWQAPGGWTAPTKGWESPHSNTSNNTAPSNTGTEQAKQSPQNNLSNGSNNIYLPQNSASTSGSTSNPYR